MIDLNKSWKDNKDIFKYQLELNLNELNSTRSYPQHWKDFLSLINSITANKTYFYSILDIGCGCGAYYALINKYYKNILYTGIDYSEEAIRIAMNQWKYDKFIVKDIWELDRNFVSEYDILHSSALFDIMNNGDEALDFILGLRPKILIISRINLTNRPSYYEKYLAYGLLETNRYYHNIDCFFSICSKHNYKVTKFETNFLLSLADE